MMIPYSMQISVALLAKNYEKANKITATAIGGAAEQIIRLANSYHAADLPFVIAALQIVTGALETKLDEPGRNILKSLTDNTTCITVDADTIRKMYDDGRDQEQ